MKYIYVDNFRGFTDQTIFLSDVNFLVGENSTGKSSLITLIGLITSKEFWLNGELEGDKYQLGKFSDSVSINSDDKSYFTVGFVVKTDEDEKNNDLGIVVTFKEREGLPVISVITYISNGEYRTLRIGVKQSKVKFGKVASISSISEDIEKCFRIFREKHKNDTTGYKLIDRAFGNVLSPLTMLYVVNIDIVEDELIKDKKGKFDPSVFTRFFMNELAWIAPIRSQPRRTYDEYKLDFTPEGDHTPYMIKKLLDKKSDAAKFKSFIRKVGLESGLFEGVKIKKYGSGATAPFELDIILNNNELSVKNVGYGVSQVLPILVEMFSRRKKSSYVLQQPEVHLHPKAQAMLGDAFFELSSKEGKGFVIETHSDYTIDRFRSNYRRNHNGDELPESQILFFERTKSGNKATSLVIDSNGDLPINQPESYRDFFVKEELMNLGI